MLLSLLNPSIDSALKKNWTNMLNMFPITQVQQPAMPMPNQAQPQPNDSFPQPAPQPGVQPQQPEQERQPVISQNQQTVASSPMTQPSKIPSGISLRGGSFSSPGMLGMRQ